MNNDASQSGESERQQEEARQACFQALRRVSLSFPHLSGLVRKVRLRVEPRISTAGVFSSGRMIVNPNFVLSLTPAELTFVLAHEVLHLALDTHGRGAGSPPAAVNIAHDYIINDILANELGQQVPAGGLDQDGARHFALEDLLSQGVRWQGKSCWSAVDEQPGLTTMGEAFAEAGLIERPQTKMNPMILDVLSASMEREFYPDLSAQDIENRGREIRSAAAKANSLQIMKEELERSGQRDGGAEGGEWVETIHALETTYRAPWQLALQRWFDAQSPAERSFARPSRRGAALGDVVLPGRKREGRTMHIILDTSGSMINDLSLALGVIGAFCENAGVGEIHLLQCDVDVTVDEWIAPEELEHYEVRGLGGSDMSPALHRLAEDPSVEAAIVITDGYIVYPTEPLPYEVLWAIIDVWDYEFAPPYGIVVQIPVDELRQN